MNRHSRARLTPRNLDEFAGETLFARLGQAVCRAGCLPRKELFEAWEAASRVRRRIRGGTIIDVAGGHGLVGFVMLLLDDSSPYSVCVDRRKPKSFGRLEAVLLEQWPRLVGRVRYEERRFEDLELPADAALVGVHACGPLTDRVLDSAIAGRHRVAVLPCCHSAARCDTGGVEAWLPVGLAVDAMRSARLRSEGYKVFASVIPEDITPENRLLIGLP